jgi:hypothetical protein
LASLPEIRLVVLRQGAHRTLSIMAPAAGEGRLTQADAWARSLEADACARSD